MPSHWTMIIGDGGRPIFDGASLTTQARFMNIVRGNLAANATQNLMVSGLRIQNYHEGIRIGGESANGLRSVGRVWISGNVFDRIGNPFAPAGATDSHSAIYITNSDGNSVVSNTFLTITNDLSYHPSYLTETTRGLHAIYVNRSHNTIVKGNHFRGVYARGVVKFRDFSNFGRVINNLFYDNTSLITDDYCDATLSICLSAGQAWNECPSYGILWSSNVIKFPRNTFRPTVDLRFHPANEPYCRSERVYLDRGLNPNAPENRVTGHPRVIDPGTNIINPSL